VCHALHDRRGSGEPERLGVADVELEDIRALALQSGGTVGHRPTDLVEDVAEFRGLPYRTQ
jgi:hypothetical protein